LTLCRPTARRAQARAGKLRAPVGSYIEAVAKDPEREFCAVLAKYGLIEPPAIDAGFFGGINAYPE